LGNGNTDVGGAAFDVNGDGWVEPAVGSTPQHLKNSSLPNVQTA